MSRSEVPLDVVIPVYNGRRHIAAAIRSALDQDGFDARVFVVDGNSTDGTPDEVRSMDDDRITLVSDVGRIGIGEARNVGARLGSSPWLTFLDADDLWPRRRTVPLLAAIVDPTNDIAIGHMIIFNDGDEPSLNVDIEPGDSPIATIAGGILFSRALFYAVGEFPEDLGVGEFIEWMARARARGVVEKYVPVVALLRRYHETNTTRTRQHEFSDYLTVIARRRAAHRRN